MNFQEIENFENEQIIKGLSNLDLLNKKILEIGCGKGTFSKEISLYSKELVSTDKDSTCIKICQLKFPNLTFIHDDITDSRLDLSYFDVLLFIRVFNFTEEILPFKDLIKQLLKKSKIYIYFPHQEYFKNGSSFYRENLDSEINKLKEHFSVRIHSFSFLELY